MNKKMKKTAALALSFGMAVTGTMVSQASSLGNASIGDVSVGTSAGAPTDAVPSGSQDSTLTGTIKVTSISVKVPTAAAFEINPASTLTGNSVDRITAQSDNYTITNTSTVPIDVSITHVATSASGGFVNTLGALSGEKTVMFAVRKSTEAAPTSDSGDQTKWFPVTPASGGDITYQVSATASDNTLAAGAALQMKLYGSTTTGWSNGNTFTVTPTFTIAVH